MFFLDKLVILLGWIDYKYGRRFLPGGPSGPGIPSLPLGPGNPTSPLNITALETFKFRVDKDGIWIS